MHVAFLNPQGNFDPKDSYWTAHPDFGGQLVYVKQVALAMGELGHTVDIVTRQVIDPDWPEFAGQFDAYPNAPNVRIVRLPAGPPGFVGKEKLWPHLIRDWVPNVLAFYRGEGRMPDAFTTHYGDGGLCGALIEAQTGIPFTFTAHSLGAQKMDKLHVNRRNLDEMDARYHFAERLSAERLSMNRSISNITSTVQERYNQYSHNAYRGAVDPTDDSRFAIVPPGVAMEIFDRSAQYAHEEAAYEHIRAALKRDLSPERLSLPCIVASSRLDPKKNHLGLVEAYAGSPTLRQRANLVIVTGFLDNPLENYESAAASEQGVLKNIIDVVDRAQLRGQISMFALRGQGELAAGYRFFAALHSIFTLTAYYEPFGLAPLEAMAAGLPAVVTKNGGPSESMREGDRSFGILVDPADPEEISAGLFSLVVSEDRWRHYAEAGYNRVLERYTWSRTAQGYFRVIERALAERDQRGATQAREQGDGQGATHGDGQSEGAMHFGSAALPGATHLLPIHPFFLDPRPENEFTLEELDDLYLKFDLLAVGETVVDFISNDKVSSLLTAERFTRYLGGQPANVAVYVAKLGARAAVLSKIGTGTFGDFVEEQLQRHGVNTESLCRTAEANTTSVFVTRTTGVPDFQVNRGADTLLSIRDVSEELVARARAVHTSCFALSREPARSAIRRAIRLAARGGKVVSLDPNYSPRVWPDKEEAWEVLAQIMPAVTIVKPSLEDARRLFDYNLSDNALEDACLRDFHELGAKVVIVTRSGGMVTISDGETVERVGPLPLVQVENVTGGRDAFWAALVVAHLDGRPWPLAVRFAHEVAALKLRVFGHVERMIDREAIYERLVEAPLPQAG